MPHSLLAAARARWIGWAALLIAVVLNGVMAATAVPFFYVPKGQMIRPIAWATWSLVIWLAGCFGVVGASIVGAVLQRTFVLSCVAVALGILALFVGGWLVRYAADLNGFILEE